MRMNKLQRAQAKFGEREVSKVVKYYAIMEKKTKDLEGNRIVKQHVVDFTTHNRREAVNEFESFAKENGMTIKSINVYK
jgi:hypothetical protein